MSKPKDEAAAEATEPLTEEPGTEAVEAEPERPDWLPQQFQSPEDLAKSYQHLQRKLTEQGQEISALRDQIENSDDAREIAHLVAENEDLAAEVDRLREGREDLVGRISRLEQAYLSRVTA